MCEKTENLSHNISVSLYFSLDFLTQDDKNMSFEPFHVDKIEEKA